MKTKQIRISKELNERLENLYDQTGDHITSKDNCANKAVVWAYKTLGGCRVHPNPHCNEPTSEGANIRVMDYGYGNKEIRCILDMYIARYENGNLLQEAALLPDSIGEQLSALGAMQMRTMENMSKPIKEVLPDV